MLGFPGGSVVRNLPANAGGTGNVGLLVSQGDPLVRKWQPTCHSCPENSMDRGDWWATAHTVRKS